MTRGELKLWKQYRAEIDKANLRQIRHMKKIHEREMKAYQQREEIQDKLLEEWKKGREEYKNKKQAWLELPLWKRIITDMPEIPNEYRWINKPPNWNPFPGLMFPTIVKPTYEDFLDWLVAKDK